MIFVFLSMNKYISFIVAISVFAFSCKSPTDAINDATEIQLFPVTDFLNGQIKEVENKPVTLLRIFTEGGTVDSSWVTRDSVRILAAPFLTHEIDSQYLLTNFTGNSFIDQTIHSITFTYDAKGEMPEKDDTKSISVYANPDDGAITRVYIMKESYANKTRAKRQLMWKTDSWFTISTISQKEDGSGPVISEEKVIWNFD